jgi:hypothetical protein
MGYPNFIIFFSLNIIPFFLREIVLIYIKDKLKGKVAEWLIAPILKIGVALRSPGVRIPPFPI